MSTSRLMPPMIRAVGAAERRRVGHACDARSIRPLDDQLFAPDRATFAERDRHRALGVRQQRPVGRYSRQLTHHRSLPSSWRAAGQLGGRGLT
jgi:hypothetical protein